MSFGDYMLLGVKHGGYVIGLLGVLLLFATGVFALCSVAAYLGRDEDERDDGTDDDSAGE